jgi:RNA polymerase sigma-70 factor (ECF subfamily)
MKLQSVSLIPHDPWQMLSELVLQHRAALVRVATREGLVPDEALECVQDALCAWMVELQREPDLGHPAWLAALKHRVRNAARNGRRRHHRLRTHVEIDHERALSDAEPNAEALLEHAENSLRLKVCVAQLREVERAVVTLRLLEERSGEDVAALLGLSRGHVDVLVHRAKGMLRACMIDVDHGQPTCVSPRVS